MLDLRDVAWREARSLALEAEWYADWCDQVRSGATTMSWPMFRSLSQSPPTAVSLKWHDGY